MWSRRQIPSWKGNTHLSCMTHLETFETQIRGLGYLDTANAIECTQKWFWSTHHNGNDGLDVFILHTFRAVRHQCQELTSPVPSCLHGFNTHFKDLQSYISRCHAWIYPWEWPCDRNTCNYFLLSNIYIYIQLDTIRPHTFFALANLM